MKQRVLVLGGLASDPRPQTEYAAEFSRLMPQYEFTEVRFDHLVFALAPGKFSITDGRTGTELSSYDLIIFRGKIRRSSRLAYIVSRYCALTNTPAFNDYSNYRPSSKLAQTVLFYEQQVPFIETYYAQNGDYLKQAVAANLTYPLILKDNYGAHGYHNYLVKDEAQLNTILAENPDIQFLAQRYHPNAGDYRVLIVGDQEPLQIWRQAASGSHLNNTSQGGSGTLVTELSEQMIDSSRQLAEALKMSIAGVDLLRSTDNDELYFLEVNSQPQLLTGAFTDEKAAMVAQYLETLLSD